MNQNEKTVAMSERDRCWADLREHGQNVADILKGKPDLKTPDFILLYQCITIVNAELLLFGDEFSDVDSKTADSIKDRSMAGSMMRTLRETGYWKDMVNKKLSNEKRTEAVHKLRKSIWANMASKQDDVMELQSTYPDIDGKGMHLIMQCAAIVALELDLKQREIDLLY
jgi:hypothetical protein